MEPKQIEFRVVDSLRGAKGYAAATVLVAIALLLRLAIWPVDAGLQYVTFFPAVTLVAVIAGFWPGIFASLLGAILALYFFTEPYYSISVHNTTSSLWASIVFLTDGAIVCTSIEAMHRYRKWHVQQHESLALAYAALERSGERYKNIFDTVLDGIITINVSGTIESFNQAAEGIFGYEHAEVIGKNISMLMPEPHQHQHDDYLCNFAATGHSSIIGVGREVAGRRKDGSTFPMELAICEIKGKTRMFTGVVRDISERKAHEAHIHHLASHDQLTGLPNRSQLFVSLATEISKARRTGQCAALLFVDLDGFKKINDEYGHTAGDVVLQTVAKRWTACVREVDTLTRMGGDEFAVVIGDFDTQGEIAPVAQKLIDALAAEIVLPSGVGCHVGVSIGIGIYPTNATNMDTLLVEADVAMYESKARGKNTYTFAQSRPVAFENTGKWLAFNRNHKIGVELIDEQHRELLRKLNHLNDAVAKQYDKQDVSRLIGEVIDYTLFQFETEARLMKEYQYPDEAVHASEHEKLKNKIARLALDFQHGNEILALHHLKDLHLNHIETTDSLLGDYLVRLGVT